MQLGLIQLIHRHLVRGPGTGGTFEKLIVCGPIFFSRMILEEAVLQLTLVTGKIGRNHRDWM